MRRGEIMYSCTGRMNYFRYPILDHPAVDRTSLTGQRDVGLIHRVSFLFAFIGRKLSL